MAQKQVTIVNRLGLHARASAYLVRSAQKFSSQIRVTRIDRNIHADAKSILSVLTLAAPQGTEILIETDGDDEETALQAMTEIFINGFGEI